MGDINVLDDFNHLGDLDDLCDIDFFVIYLFIYEEEKRRNIHYI